nr:erf1 methyltransferase catalytic subunit mtq2 [Quercus suber]
MLPTPSTSHVNYDHIYEPAEDSYLLLDTLSSATESAWLQSRFTSSVTAPVILEVGTGSGVVLAFVTAHARSIFGSSDVATLGVDVNRFACQATIQTVKCAVEEAMARGTNPAHFLGCLQADLTTGVRPRSVDVLIFNPPYVPTESLPALANGHEAYAGLSSNQIFERDSHLLALSYAGGIDGMETTNRLLQNLPTVLSDRGVAYVLLCAQNHPEDVKSHVASLRGSWSAEVVGSSGKKAGWEKLCILRICRTQVEPRV